MPPSWVVVQFDDSGHVMCRENFKLYHYPQLYRELLAQGGQVHYDAVRRFLRRRLGSSGRPGPRTAVTAPPAAPPPSARQLSFAFIRRPRDRKAEDQSCLDRLCAGSTVLQEGLALASEWAAMIRRESKRPFGEWLVKAEQSSVGELQGLAASLRQDEAAVAAALTERWSNGPVEGHVNRLKWIKRQMYGRASFDLLRARVRHAG